MNSINVPKNALLVLNPELLPKEGFTVKMTVSYEYVKTCPLIETDVSKTDDVIKNTTTIEYIEVPVISYKDMVGNTLDETPFIETPKKNKKKAVVTQDYYYIQFKKSNFKNSNNQNITKEFINDELFVMNTNDKELACLGKCTEIIDGLIEETAYFFNFDTKTPYEQPVDTLKYKITIDFNHSFLFKDRMIKLLSKGKYQYINDLGRVVILTKIK